MQADRSTQRAATRLCIQCGLFLLQHGAESALVEELSTRLGLALVLFIALLWTALEAWSGPPAERAGRWAAPAALLLGLAFGQSLLGGLVAGNDAGRVYTDFPLMGGRLVPPEYGGGGLWATLAQAARRLTEPSVDVGSGLVLAPQEGAGSARRA